MTNALPPISFRTLTLGCLGGEVEVRHIFGSSSLGGGVGVPTMDPTVLLYVDAVLRARDTLLSANIKVVGYISTPTAGALSAYPIAIASEHWPR